MGILMALPQVGTQNIRVARSQKEAQVCSAKLHNLKVLITPVMAAETETKEERP